MNPLFLVFLFLHIGAAIVAFGPTFAFPLIAAAGQKNPQHAAFAAELSERIESKVVLPLALSMPVTGALLIITGDVNLFQPWLLAAIAIYLVAISYSVVVQGPAGRELAHILGAMSPGAAGSGEAAVISGPPPRVAELGAKLQRGGMLLAALLVAIVVLMVIGSNA
ncbi:MAG: DUF2269 family protein [Chloroflexota bacterium]